MPRTHQLPDERVHFTWDTGNEPVLGIDSGDTVEHAISPGRHAWVQVVRGRVAVNGHELGAGDGAALSDEPLVGLAAREPTELLLFDLA